MILPQTYAAALLLMTLGMLCWGSWANTYKASRWRFELYYFDFAVGALLLAILLAITAGSLGFDGFTFIDDTFHAGKRQWLFAFLGGVVLNLANMLLVSAIGIAGMTVAFPVAMGVALIIGVISSYVSRAAANPLMTLGACAIILGAILVGAIAYKSISDIRHEEEAKAGRAKSTRRPSVVKGIVVALISGVLMAFAYPLLTTARAGDFGLGPYALAVFFAGGLFFSTFVFNLFFMNLPLQGEPLDFMDYFSGRPGAHLMGFLGGAIWMAGAAAYFIGSSADAVHLAFPLNYALREGYALIAAGWGILIWKEFRGAEAKTQATLGLMLVLYAVGIGLVAIAPLVHGG